MTAKLHTLEIDRRRWYRGRGGDSSMLRTLSGKQCCLGFACRDAGLTAKEIACQVSPGDIPMDVESAQALQSRLGVYSFLIRRPEEHWNLDTGACSELMCINDSAKLSDQEREKQIKTIFRKHHIRIVFKN